MTRGWCSQSRSATFPGAWHEMPESSYGVAGGGDSELRPFRPKPPEKATAVPA